jgi:hypothetical protein
MSGDRAAPRAPQLVTERVGDIFINYNISRRNVCWGTSVAENASRFNKGARKFHKKLARQAAAKIREEQATHLHKS